MENLEVHQKNVTAGGDIAVGDIDKSLTINKPSSKSPLANLIEKYHQERVDGVLFDSIIEKLQHWKDPDPEENTQVLGVREKLQKGSRLDLVRFGLRAKEIFTKCLMRHQHSHAAQEIFAYLLASVWQKFNGQIHTRISDGMSNAQIDALVQSEVVEAVETLLDSNPLQIDQAEIAGMIYFLTGNCHINWHKC